MRRFPLVIGLVAVCLGIQAGAAERPAWIDQPSGKYPNAAYLTAVGVGSDHQQAENAAYAAMAKVFRADIRAKLRIWQQTAETTTRKRTISSKDILVDELNEVSSKKLLEGVSLKESWRDDANNTSYALAVLDRRQASRALQDKLKEQDRDIALLQDKVAKSSDILDAIRLQRKLIGLLIRRDIHNTDYRIVSPEGKGIDAAISLVAAKEQLTRMLSHDLSIGVRVNGPHRDAIHSYLVEAMTGEGFRVDTRPSAKPGLLVKASVKFTQSDLPEWKFVNYKASVDLIDGSTSKIISNISLASRAGHVTMKEAEERAVKQIRQEIAERLGRSLIDHIYGESE